MLLILEDEVGDVKREEIEAFFCTEEDVDDEENWLVCIEITGSDFTYIGYIHDWEKPPYEDCIYFQEEDDLSGRMPITMIKSIRWLHRRSSS